MAQQKAATANHVSQIEARQKSMVEQQRLQTEALLRQIQTQVEADMRLKSEMTRNQVGSAQVVSHATFWVLGNDAIQKGFL